MARKDHLLTVQSDSKLSKKFESRNNVIAFQAQQPTIAQQINGIGATSKTPDEVKDTKFPVLNPIDAIGKNLSAVLDIDLSLENSPFHCLELSDVGATVATLTVNLINLVKNKAEKFILDITKDPANTIDPTIAFSPTVENLPAGFPTADPRYLLEIVARETPNETRFEVVNRIGTTGVSFPLTPDIEVHGNVTGTVTVDLSLTTAHWQQMVLIGNITFVFSNPPVTDKELSFILEITQDATGGRTVQWPPEVRVDPAVGSAANARTVIIVTTVDNGVNYDALIVTGGEIDAANKTLSNLVSPTSINQDLLFSAATFDIANTTNPVDNLFVKQIRLQNGILGTNIPNIVSEDGNQMTFNVDTAQIFLWKIASITKMTMAASSLNLNDVMNLDNATGMTYFNAGFDPIANGEFRLNGTDMKVFSGGAVRNFSDIVAGGGNEFEDDVFRIIDNLDNTKKLAFQVSSLTTATTRTITIPDANFTLGGLGLNQSWSGVNSFTSDVNLGNDTADTITFIGRIDSDIEPNLDITRNFGSDLFKWGAVFLRNLRFDASTQLITANATEMRFALPTADVFNWEINLVDQLTLSASVLNVHGNDITNTGEIVSTSGNVDVGDATTGFDAFFGRRIEFPNVLGVAVAANRQIISTTVSAVNTIRMNLPLNEDFMITENAITSPVAFHIDTSAGTLTLDDPIFTLRINNSSVFAITKTDATPALFSSSNGFNFEDIVKILTPAGQVALEFDGVDGTPDVGLINTPSNVDFEYSAGGTNKMRFDASANEFQFNADIVRIQERLNVKETAITPPTPPVGQCTLFLFDDGGAEPNNSLRVKFDNGNVQTLATEV